MNGSPAHDASWQPVRDFMDMDGIKTGIWVEYIRKKNIIPEYHDE